MVLLPLVCSKIDVPVIAAGGIVDGRSMAAAFALGAEGVQLGTRMVSAAESPVHDNFKQAICDSAETDTVFLNRHSRPGLRAIRTSHTEELERAEHVDMGEFGRILDLYFGGDMEASIALSGQVVGRIEEVRPVAEILHGMIDEFLNTVTAMSRKYAGASA
jgi:enoyl-[acyl-carrier protein] reductase II